MKKTWVALALAGVFAGGAAHAQSSVTLYGIADVGYTYDKIGNADGINGITSGNQSGSRLGFRGSEDLGGGWKGIFTLEAGYDIDRGVSGQGGRLFGRQAWAGLETGWGTVVAGRIAALSSGTGSFDFFGRVDPFLTGFGIAGVGSTFLSSAALRVDNAAAYISPTFAGFKFGTSYSFNTNGAEQTPSDNNNRHFGLAANWSGGPFFAVVTYDNFDRADNSNPGGISPPDQSVLQLGGTFDIGGLRLHAGYAMHGDVSTILQPPNVGPGSGQALPAGLTFDANAFMLGATYKMGAWSFFGSYQMFDGDSVIYQGANFEADYDVWGIGTTYNMSRRTNFYLAYGSRGADGTLTDAVDRDTLWAGMRHLF